MPERFSLSKLRDEISKYASTLQLIFGGSVMTVIGVISGTAAKHTTWISQHGPAAWWFAGLLGALIAALILLGIAWLRYVWISGGAISHWTTVADQVNPLDREFHKRRINVQQIVSPITNRIVDKVFTDCELIGPANLLFMNDVHVTHAGLVNCDVVIIEPAPEIAFYNAIGLQRVRISGGSIARCTLFMPAELAATIPDMNVVNRRTN